MALPRPPKAHQEFVERFPELGRAWDLIAHAGASGPLDERTARLVKLGLAVGALREGSVHSSVRKALAIGITAAEIEQVVALSAGTLGMPAVVAVHSWVRAELKRAGGHSEGRSPAAAADAPEGPVRGE